MDGAMSMGDLLASTVAHSISSAMPEASLAMLLAVAGAMAIISAVANDICSTSDSELRVNILVITGLPVMVWNVRGAMNLVAASVIITSTFAPDWVNWLAMSLPYKQRCFL